MYVVLTAIYQACHSTGGRLYRQLKSPRREQA